MPKPIPIAISSHSNHSRQSAMTALSGPISTGADSCTGIKGGLSETNSFVADHLCYVKRR